MLLEVSFGEWLKRRRLAMGLKQEQLALQLHCSTSALRKFESEERRPSADIVERLADIFSIPPDERKSFLRFARGDWQSISSSRQEETPWRASIAPSEKQTKTVSPRHNLPLHLATFIGRQKELTEMTDLLSRHRLLTLVGVGGIGKTRLSLEVAREALQMFPDGLWFIEFAPLSDPESLPQVTVNTLGLIGQTNIPPQVILNDYLQGKKTLLIFDNCEHLIQACAHLAEELLNACPDLHILATSREGLGITGEMQYLVPTLTCPDALNTTLESLSTFEAVQLFLERAQIAQPGFAITPANAPAIAQVCQRLDGIPLALELAAARLKLLSVDEIAARLDNSFRLLTGGARTALPRHQTLQAMIDWSHDLLTEAEQVMFRRLSVFADGWTLETAEAVTAGNENETPHIQPSLFILHHFEILDLLTSLVNKSLLLAEHEDGQETRYHMLETIRQYAHARLFSAGEEEWMRQRHLTCYVEMAERAEPHLRAFDMASWLDRLEAEYDNIRAALEWAYENNNELHLRLASALLWFWHIRGHKNEGVEWIERALSIEALDRGSQLMTTERALLRGKALNVSGSLMVMNHEFARAPMRLEESLALFKELGPAGKQGMGYALLRLGAMLPAGDIEAKRKLEQSLAIFREIGDKFGIAECLLQLTGHAASFTQKGDDFSQAISFAEEQLELRREIGDLDGIAVALTTLGDLVLSQDDYEKAIVLFEEAVTSFRAMGNAGAVSLSLNGYGDIFFQRGEYQRAAEIYEEALSLANELGYKFIIACSRYNLGVIAWFQGEYTRAVQWIAGTQPIFRNIGHHWLSATSLHLCGDIALAEGDADGATQWYEEELSFNRMAQLGAVQIFALEGLGKVAWMQGDYDLAAKHFKEALGMSRTENVKPAIFNALYLLGRTAQSKGDHTLARELYVEALQTQARRIVPLFRWASLKTYQSSISHPLAACAQLAMLQNNIPHAVHLFGAAETLYRALRFEMSARERAEHEQAISDARAALGEGAFTHAWENGKKMTLNEAVEYALREV